MVLGAVSVISAFAPALNAGQKTVKDSVFTQDQAKRGEQLFKKECATCHGDDLSGGLGPAVAGPEFLSNWDKAPLSDLVEWIQTQMPADSPGTLSAKQSADLVSYMLQTSKLPAGPSELSDDPAVLKSIAIAK